MSSTKRQATTDRAEPTPGSSGPITNYILPQALQPQQPSAKPRRHAGVTRPLWVTSRQIAVQNGMSALPPKADIMIINWNVDQSLICIRSLASTSSPFQVSRTPSIQSLSVTFGESAGTK